MENAMVLNGYEINEKMNDLKEAYHMEKTFKAQNETFVITLDDEKTKNLTLIFNKAQDKIAKALLHRGVEKDIMKAKEQFDHGIYMG